VYSVCKHQNKTLEILKDLSKNARDNVLYNPISHKKWRQFYKHLRIFEQQYSLSIVLNEQNNYPVTIDKLLPTRTQFKNLKHQADMHSI
jgi:hypothetical protein